MAFKRDLSDELSRAISHLALGIPAARGAGLAARGIGRVAGPAARGVRSAGRSLGVGGRLTAAAGAGTAIGTGSAVVGRGPRSPAQDRSRPDINGRPAPGFGPASPVQERGTLAGEFGGPPEGGGPGGLTMEELMALMGGEGGGVDTGALASSYDAQIAALRGGGQRIAGLTDQLVGNIGSSAGAANQQIGSFFDYAQGQAEAGRAPIAESYGTASTNVDELYDTLAGNLTALPGQLADAARGAGGSAAGGTVADRVATAAAPFAAAGESSRAGTQANLQTHSTAGQDYLTQLASAAPSEAAMNQAAVTGRANQAVTSAQMALAQQQAQIEAQAAGIEGAKQRALLEASADTGPSTMDRMMQAQQFLLGQQQLEGGGIANQAALQELLGEEGESAPFTGRPGFDQEISGLGGGQQQFAMNILGAAEGAGLDPLSVISRLTTEKPREEPGFLGIGTRQVGGATFDTMDEFMRHILANPGDQDATLYSPVDPNTLRRAVRRD